MFLVALNMNSEYEKQLEPEFEEFLKMIGRFLRKERELIGYSSADTFGNKIDIEGATIRTYEIGKGRMTLQRFYTLIRGLNKTKEEIFTELITGSLRTLNSTEFALSKQQEGQVRGYLEKTISSELMKRLSPDDISRLYLMLTYCLNKNLKKSELKNMFGLSKYTENFNKVLKVAIDAKWINMTNQEGKRDRNQQYYTSEEGVKVLRLGA